MDETAGLVLLAAILFGGAFRILPAWQAGFPINDGGMFYTMIVDLQANHFIAPAYTTYNQVSIPFVYPPLGFYLAGAISSLLKISPVMVLQWLPGILNTCTIPAFYFFAREITGNKLQAGITSLIYAATPHLTSWLSMGGGLTRSLGMLFMLLTLGYTHRVFTRDNHRDMLGVVIFGALTVLSHTEAPVYAVAIAMYIWLIKSRSRKGFFKGIIIAAGIFILAAPWYWRAISIHGFGPLLSISQSGNHSLGAIFKLINIQILTEEPFLGLLGSLGILGIAMLVANKNFFIPVMLPVIYLTQPRSAHIMANLPLALAAGYFIVEILLPSIQMGMSRGKWAGGFLAVLAVYLFGNSIYYELSLATRHLSQQDRFAMEWVERNTSQKSSFLVISGNQNAFCDPITEWFPSIAMRKSVTTIQGSEWLAGEKFGDRSQGVQQLQACLDNGLECLTTKASQLGVTFDHIYVSINPPTENCGPSEFSERETRVLVKDLENAQEYSLEFRSDAVAIFSAKDTVR